MLNKMLSHLRQIHRALPSLSPDILSPHRIKAGTMRRTIVRYTSQVAEKFREVERSAGETSRNENPRIVSGDMRKPTHKCLLKH